MFNKHLLTDWWNKPTQDLGDNAFFVCVLREHRWVHFYYQAFLPHWREQASQNLNHQQRGSCSQKKPSGFFHTCVHSQQQSRAQLLLNNAELWRHTPDANQPWRHPGLLTMNIITATSNRLHIKKKKNPTKNKQKKQLHWVTILEKKKTVLQLIYKAPLSLPASFFCKRAEHEVPSFLFHRCTSVPTWFISERMRGHVTSLRPFTATSLSLLGLQVGLRQVLQEVSVLAPVLLCPPALRSSGLMLDIQLSGYFAIGWHWCLPPPTFPQHPLPTQTHPPAPQRRQLSLPDTTTAMACDPPALLRCTWSFSRPQTLFLKPTCPAGIPPLQ